MNVSEELIREIVQKVLAEAKQQESGEDFVKEKVRTSSFFLNFRSLITGFHLFQQGFQPR